MIKRLLPAALAAGLLASGSAWAGEVLITLNGTFGELTPTTDISAPFATFSLSFNETNPLGGSAVVGQGWATTVVTNFSYLLNGVAVTDAFAQAEFYDATNNGGIDITFTTPGPGSVILSTYGNDVGSTGVVAPDSELTESVSINDGLPTNTGDLEITAVTPTGTPEPASWALMLLGVGAVGASLRRRRSPIAG